MKWGILRPIFAGTNHSNGADVPPLTLQLHHHGGWHDAATLAVHDPAAGIRGSTAVDYEATYFTEWAATDLLEGRPVRDWRALSVGFPVDLQYRSLKSWPAFVLDLLPQGHARRRLSQQLELNPDDPASEYPLLLRGAGCPVGNIRVKEAWAAEQGRIADLNFAGLDWEDIVTRSDRFTDMADRYALIASGSSGVQGEWPKVLLTRAADGRWFPDSLIEDADAREHVIVKLSRGRDAADHLILEAEAPYLEVARVFGLRVHQALTYERPRKTAGVLIIPRFDRKVATGGGVVRLGQESVVAAAGVAEFGFRATHERYLETLNEACTDPVAEATEYVLRDVLNLAMGNPDNHGRNTALQKREDGWIGLTPLFDFSPMRLDTSGVMRFTRWACLGAGEPALDWNKVCTTVAAGLGLDDAQYDQLLATLAAKEPFIRDLPNIARQNGVPQEVIERACDRHAAVADSLARIRGLEPCHAQEP